MWRSLRRARELIGAAGHGPQQRGDVSADNARLLDAAGVLVAVAPAIAVPDALFSANLKASLLSRYDELVAAGEKPARPKATARRLAWIALPAVSVAVAVVLALAFFVFKPAGPAAVARLSVQNGYARVTDAGGKTSRVKGNADIHRGDIVLIPGGSRATITYKNKNITRLEAGSELEVVDYGEELVEVALARGKAYNRVIPGTSYSVNCRGLTVSAAGTAFDVDAVGPEILAPVFESQAKVSWTGAPVVVVDQGFLAKVTGGPGSYSVQVVPLNLAELDFSWLAFNRDLDRKLGFPLGVLEGLTPTPPEGNLPPDAPASSAPGAEQASQPTQPGSQPTQPGAQPSSSLSLSDSGPPVYITWTSANVGASDTVAVLRADGAATPSYPANVLDASQGAGATSYHDERVVGGRTYTYRVAYLAGGNVLVYSNPTTATVPAPAPPPPPPSLYLGGELAEDGMHLKWYMEGSAEVGSWAVLASQKDPNPSYPGSQVATVPYSGSRGSYIFGGASSTASYYFRVAALSGGSVVFYSNVIRSGP